MSIEPAVGMLAAGFFPVWYPMVPFSSRFSFALKVSALHLLGSLVVTCCASLLVFYFWFPFPYGELGGGWKLFWILIGVDVVCGPLLTLVLFSPTKPRTELRHDFALIMAVQLSALLYGLHTLSQARPLALVYEVDRFRAVSMSDLDEKDLAASPNWLRPWSLAAPRLVGLRTGHDAAELLKSIDLAAAGLQAGQRPSLWQDYALNVSQVLERSHPLSELRAKHPNQTALLDHALTQARRDAKAGDHPKPETLRWLPLVSRKVMDWVVLIDPVTARVRGYVHLDGF